MKRRRKQLHLRQQDFKEFDQSYISRIEKGEYNPTKRETIEQLAERLDIPKHQFDWFWAYSLFDRDPHEYFGKKIPVVYHAAESSTAYGNGNSTVIQIGDSERDVLRKMGEPDRRIEVPATKSKWIYRADDLHIIFVNGKVNEVVFK